MSYPIVYLAFFPAAALCFQDCHCLERTWRLEVFGEHRQTSQLTVDKERSLSAAHRRMKTMFKKFHFTLRAGLLLVDASLASNQPAGASPNVEQGPGMDAYHNSI
jgi:hypothetical protein